LSIAESFFFSTVQNFTIVGVQSKDSVCALTGEEQARKVLSVKLPEVRLGSFIILEPWCWRSCSFSHFAFDVVMNACRSAHIAG
jgi:hypothetical protein